MYPGGAYRHECQLHLGLILPISKMVSWAIPTTKPRANAKFKFKGVAAIIGKRTCGSGQMTRT